MYQMFLPLFSPPEYLALQHGLSFHTASLIWLALFDDAPLTTDGIVAASLVLRDLPFATFAGFARVFCAVYPDQDFHSVFSRVSSRYFNGE